MTNNSKPWNITDSLDLYGLQRWGEGYFHISDDGTVTIHPTGKPDDPPIRMDHVLTELKNQNIKLPAVIRFHDILHSQVLKLNHTFKKVIQEANYDGDYYGVFPIKVNQLREVVEEILNAGTAFKYGLEAGSKSELLAVLALNDDPQRLTILNGYKDDDYLRLAMLGRKLGRPIIVVIEKFSELKRLFAVAQEMNVQPLIGFRAKLATAGSGRWSESGGDSAKFGLTIPEIISGINFLKAKKLISSLQLFHFHIGSQITDIRTIKDAITESARIYAQLMKMGAPIKYFDVGGGMAVDYIGSNSLNSSSMNYNLKDYAEDVVYILQQICELEKVSVPNIVSESGRLITAHHSLVVTNVIGSTKLTETSQAPIPVDSQECHVIVKNMRDFLEDLSEDNCLEVYNDAVSKKEECINAFKLGILSLEERAQIESLFWRICHNVRYYTFQKENLPEELNVLHNKLAAIYHCNFSVFQSTLDAWSIGQLLPILPLQRLDQRPDIPCTLSDITCDSDGKIDEFIHNTNCSVSNHKHCPLMLHSLKPDEEYHLGIFLTGAYQDIMGDMHNLFGKLNEIHIYGDKEDPMGFYIEEVIEGNTCGDVLKLFQYSPDNLAMKVKKELDKQVGSGKLRPREAVLLTDFYEKCLDSYTYLT